MVKLLWLAICDLEDRRARRRTGASVHLAHAADGTSAGMRPRRRPSNRWTPRPSLQWVLDRYSAPAIVRNGRMDLLAANHLGRAMHACLYQTTPPGAVPNFVRFTFLHVHAAHDFYADRDLQDLVGELSTRSDDFRRRWGAHNVRSHGAGTKHFHHRDVGDLELAYESLDMISDPGTHADPVRRRTGLTHRGGPRPARRLDQCGRRHHEQPIPLTGDRAELPAATRRLVLAGVALLALTACSVSDPVDSAIQSHPVPPTDPPTSPSTGPPAGSAAPDQTSPEESQPVTAIRISVAGKTITAHLNDTPTAHDLARQLPLTLRFRDFNRVEKVAELPRPLTMEGVPAGDDPDIDDIGYYAPSGALVFYYGDVGYWNGIVRIGGFSHGDIDLIRRQPDGFTITIEQNP